jgi:hypothetical protein
MTWIRFYKSPVWHAVLNGSAETRCGLFDEFATERKEFLHDERRCSKCEARQK